MQVTSMDSPDPLTVIGWQECMSLPELGLSDFAVKIDTGAKTTALHAEKIETFVRSNAPWVRFERSAIAGAEAHSYEFPIHASRAITNTSGRPETRIVIRTPMILAQRKWKIDISLTDRGSMRFPLILGRRALRKRKILVDPSRSYLVSEKPQFEGQML